MTKAQYHRAINRATLHNFPFLANALLSLYFSEYPEDRQFNGPEKITPAPKPDTP